MTVAACEILGISKQRGIWLRCFLERRMTATILQIPVLVIFGCVSVAALAQTVCIKDGRPCSPDESREMFNAICKAEKAPANLFVAHSVRLTGTFFDPTGAPIDFDSIKPDHQTIVQIKSPASGEVLFAVPLRTNGEFEFELVPEGNYRLILVWMKDGKFERLPLTDQPKEIRCSDLKECRITSTITFHGSDNPLDYCAPK